MTKQQPHRVKQGWGGGEVEARQEKAVGLAFPPGGTSQGPIWALNVKVATLWAQGVAVWGARASVSLLYVMIWWVVTTACGALMSCSEAGTGKGDQEERREMWGWQCCDGLGSSQASKFQSKQKKKAARAPWVSPRTCKWPTSKAHGVTAHKKHTQQQHWGAGGKHQRRVIWKCVRVCAQYLVWANQKSTNCAATNLLNHRDVISHCCPVKIFTHTCFPLGGIECPHQAKDLHLQANSISCQHTRALVALNQIKPLIQADNLKEYWKINSNGIWIAPTNYWFIRATIF